MSSEYQAKRAAMLQRYIEEIMALEEEEKKRNALEVEEEEKREAFKVEEEERKLRTFDTPPESQPPSKSSKTEEKVRRFHY